jgi:hypothetical protein
MTTFCSLLSSGVDTDRPNDLSIFDRIPVIMAEVLMALTYGNFLPLFSKSFLDFTLPVIALQYFQSSLLPSWVF